jgi:hypothetical protein
MMYLIGKRTLFFKPVGSVGARVQGDSYDPNSQFSERRLTTPDLIIIEECFFPFGNPMADRGKGQGRSDSGHSPEYLESEDEQARDIPAGDQGGRLRSIFPQPSPQYVVVPPNIEAQQVISPSSTFLSYSSNPAL